MRRAWWLMLLLSFPIAACSSGPVQGRSVKEMNMSTLEYNSTPSSYSGEDDFTWQNTMGTANIQFAGTALTSGSVQVTIQGPDGHYATSMDVLADGGPVVVNQYPDDGGFLGNVVGAAGEWQFAVTYSDASGTVAMTVTPG